MDLESLVGQGTTVRVYFPAAPDVPRDGAPAVPTGPHILFVEDEEMLASLSKRQLEASGFMVTAFTSAAISSKVRA